MVGDRYNGRILLLLPTMATPTYNGRLVQLQPVQKVRPKSSQASLPVPRITQAWVADLVKAAALEAVTDGMAEVRQDKAELTSEFRDVLNQLLGLVGDLRERDKQILALQDEIMELRSDIQQISDRISASSVQ